MVMLDEEFVKKRLEKDLHDLKKMIANHFEQRKKDEAVLDELKERIEKRKKMREEQMEQRAQREKERLDKERQEKQRKQEEEDRRIAAEEAKKKEAMQALAASFVGQKNIAKNRGGRGERERKKKVLAERRKALNIDHLDHDKLINKVEELFNYLKEIEEQRYDYEEERDFQKYRTVVTRVRCNMLMTKKQRKNVKRF
jgi:chemotaxis protein histidine kinase CheA